MTQFATASRFAALVLMAGMICSVSAMAQEDVGGSAASSRQPRMWWNDNGYIVRLKLNPAVRAQMDKVWGGYQAPLAEIKPGRVRTEFNQALREGNFDLAKKRLETWAESEKREVMLRGDMRMDVLSLLSSDQLSDYLSAAGHNLGGQWRERPRWPLRPKPFSQR